jgi:hypothetical protein
LFLLTPLTVACVGRDFDPIGRELPCALESPGASPESAVVVLRAPVADTWLTICSGVAIAPRLVATQLKCVLGRSEPARTEASIEATSPLPLEDRTNRSGSTDFDSQCVSDAGWAPLEDGDFSARLGDRLDPSQLSVAPVWVAPEVLGVAATGVFVMPASSLCGDDMAFVVLERALEVPQVAIRFGETLPGQDLILSGFCNNGDTNLLERRELASVVQGVTATSAESHAPPRALITSNTVAAYAAGGAAIAPESNAVVGLIRSGALVTDCEESDSEGATLVMALAPYRRLLLDVADAVGETLYSEPQRDMKLRKCAVQPD